MPVPRVPILIRHLRHLRHGCVLVCAWPALWAQTTAPTIEPGIELEPLIVGSQADTATPGYDPTGMGSVEADSYDSPFSNDLLMDEIPVETVAIDVDADAATAGVSAAEQAASGVRVNLRGFPTPRLRDSYSQTGVPEILNIGRSQNIQGPLIPVTGRAAPGGIQNFITNRPKAKAETRFAADMSDNDTASLRGETTGVLIKRKAWQRLAGEWNRRDGPQAFAWQETRTAMAAVSVRPTKRTSAMLQVDFLSYRGNPSPGLPEYRATHTSPIIGPYRPLALFHGYGPDAGVRRRLGNATLQLETQLSARTLLRAAVQAMVRELDEDRFTRGVLELDSMTFGGTREPQHIEQPLRLITGQVDATTRFKVGRSDHKISVAVDSNRVHSERTQRALTTADRDALLPLSVRRFRPDAADYYRPPYSPELYRRVTTDREDITRYSGLSLSDRSAFARGKYVLTVGVRYDTVSLDVHDRRTTASMPFVSDTTQETTYHAGANVVLVPGKIMAFGNYSTAFEPSTRLDARTNRIQGNEITDGYEVGFKGAWNRKINYTVHYFEFTNGNISRRNPRYNDPVLDPLQNEPELLAAGEEFFRGGVADLRFQPTPRLRVTGRLDVTHATTTVSPDVPAEVNRPLVRSPRHNLTLGARYEWNVGRLKGLNVGGGYSYTSGYVARYQDATRAYLAYPSVGLTNARVGYQWKRTRFTHEWELRVRNLFDEDLLALLDQPGRGREFGAGYSLRF